MAGDFTVRFLARTFLAARLGGLSPAALTEGERADLHEFFDTQRAESDQALEILQRVGYGRPRGRRPRKDRAHGQRRRQRLEGLVGKLPRAAAKRLPTSADTHRRGRRDGRDIHGPVACSHTLRSSQLAVLAAAGGLWQSRNSAAHPYAETTAGELAQLITGRERLGGKDVADIHRLLAELEQLEISGKVNRPKDGSVPNPALEIPGSPVRLVERRLPDGRWVNAHFRVWAHPRPAGQRLYAWLQATHRDSYDDAIEFYLAAPLRYTFGLHGRQQRAAASVRAALNQIYAADQRYYCAPKWSIRGRYANTNLPAFRIGPHRRGSAPTERALARTKCPAERPAALRGLTRRCGFPLGGRGRSDPDPDRKWLAADRDRYDPGTGRLTAKIPDNGSLPVGNHALRAVVSDAVGNTTTITSDADGTPEIVTEPLRTVTQVRVGRSSALVKRCTLKRVKIRRRGKLRHQRVAARLLRRCTQVKAPRKSRTTKLRFNQEATVAGLVQTADGQPLANAPVHVTAQALGWRAHHLATITTNDHGQFRYTIPAGPSRTITFSFAAARHCGPATTRPPCASSERPRSTQAPTPGPVY